jgi:hypothetical protein
MGAGGCNDWSAMFCRSWTGDLRRDDLEEMQQIWEEANANDSEARGRNLNGMCILRRWSANNDLKKLINGHLMGNGSKKKPGTLHLSISLIYVGLDIGNRRKQVVKCPRFLNIV